MMMASRYAYARAGIAGLFIFFIIVQCGALVISYISGAFYADELQNLIVQLLTLYSIPFGVIIGGIFGHKARSTNKSIQNAFWIAFIMALVWNFLLTVRTIAFVLTSEDSVLSLSTYLDTVSAGGMFLVSGSLTYFFTRR